MIPQYNNDAFLAFIYGSLLGEPVKHLNVVREKPPELLTDLERERVSEAEKFFHSGWGRELLENIVDPDVALKALGI